jgi:hypothetical protein
VGLNSLKSLNLTNVYPNKNNKKKKNNKVKSKPLELFELAGKKCTGAVVDTSIYVLIYFLVEKEWAKYNILCYHCDVDHWPFLSVVQFCGQNTDDIIHARSHTLRLNLMVGAELFSPFWSIQIKSQWKKSNLSKNLLSGQTRKISKITFLPTVVETSREFTFSCTLVFDDSSQLDCT